MNDTGHVGQSTPNESEVDRPPTPHLVGNWGKMILDLVRIDIDHPNTWTYWDQDRQTAVDFNGKIVKDFGASPSVDSKLELYKEHFQNDMQLPEVKAYVRRQDPVRGLEQIAELSQLLEESWFDFNEDRSFESVPMDVRIKRHDRILVLAKWLELIGDALTTDQVFSMIGDRDDADDPSVFGMSMDEVIAAKSPRRPSPTASTSKPLTPQPRLRVSNEGKIRIDEEWHNFKGTKRKTTRLADFFRELIEKKTYVSLSDHDLRSDDIEKQPSEIKSLIKRQPGAGCIVHQEWIS